MIRGIEDAARHFPAPETLTPKPPPARDVAPARTLSRGSRIFVGTATVVLLGANVAGAAYYASPMSERVRSAEHAWLRPSGYVGQSAGILAALIFAFLWMYPARKSLKALAKAGPLSRWLDIHIAFALTLPLLLAVHSGWRFFGIIGLGFGAMMIVWASGIVGRYLYVRIPRSRSGLELSMEEIAAERRSMVTEIAAKTGLDPRSLEQTLGGGNAAAESRGIVSAFAAMVAADRARRRMTRELRHRWRHLPDRPALDDATLDAAVDLATREIALTQQVRFLRTTHRIFRWWHLLHKPLAIMAAIAVVIHVAVVVAVGSTWFW